MVLNDMELVFKKSWYNKTKVQPDGITHIVDTETQYPVYQLGIGKNYFVDTREEALDAAIADLKELVIRLEKVKLQNENENKEIEI